jgi:hypothetical protein
MRSGHAAVVRAYYTPSREELLGFLSRLKLVVGPLDMLALVFSSNRNGV